MKECKQKFIVIHPLDDIVEQKIDISTLGPMELTKINRIALMSLRGYLVSMMLMVLYHFISAAGNPLSHILF